MSLGHSRPPDSLLRELKEVARDAAELVLVLERGLNFPLPADFPKNQLLDISRSLIQLPDGTAEGSRAPLDYASHRLPALRRQHIPSEDLTLGEADPAVSRGTVLDQRLGTLMVSVSTALDEYRRLASDEGDANYRAEAGVVPKASAVRETLHNTQTLDSSLATAQETVQRVTEPGSSNADDLKRQLKDARGLNQLTSAEIRMPRVVVSWLRKTADALKDYPAIIKRTVEVMRVGIDVTEPLVDSWQEFKHKGSKLVFRQIRKTINKVEQEIVRVDQPPATGQNLPKKKRSLANRSWLLRSAPSYRIPSASALKNYLPLIRLAHA